MTKFCLFDIQLQRKKRKKLLVVVITWKPYPYTSLSLFTKDDNEYSEQMKTVAINKLLTPSTTETTSTLACARSDWSKTYVLSEFI